MERLVASELLKTSQGASAGPSISQLKVMPFALMRMVRPLCVGSINAHQPQLLCKDSKQSIAALCRRGQHVAVKCLAMFRHEVDDEQNDVKLEDPVVAVTGQTHPSIDVVDR